MYTKLKIGRGFHSKIWRDALEQVNQKILQFDLRINTNDGFSLAFRTSILKQFWA